MLWKCYEIFMWFQVDWLYETINKNRRTSWTNFEPTSKRTHYFSGKARNSLANEQSPCSSEHIMDASDGVSNKQQQVRLGNAHVLSTDLPCLGCLPQIWFDFAWQQKKLDRQQTRSLFHKVCVHDLQSCGLDARLAFDSFFVGPCSHFFDYLASSLVCCSLPFVPFKKNQWHALGAAQEAPCSGKFAWLGDHPSLVNRTGASVEVVSEMEIVEFKKGWSCDVVGSHQLSLRSSAFQIVDSTFISWSVAWGWSSTRGTMQVPSEVASQFSCSKLCWLSSPFEHRSRQQGQLPENYRQLWDS